MSKMQEPVLGAPSQKAEKGEAVRIDSTKVLSIHENRNALIAQLLHVFPLC
jgi:hypothetical protein